MFYKNNLNKDIQNKYHIIETTADFIFSVRYFNINNINKKKVISERLNLKNMEKVTKIWLNLHKILKQIFLFVYYNECSKLHLIWKNNLSSFKFNTPA